MKKKSVRLCLWVLAGICLLSAISFVYLYFQEKEYSCIVKGQSFRYKNGVRVNEKIPDEIQFLLNIPTYGHSFELGKNDFFYAHQGKKITFDKSRSTDAESIFLHDEIDSSSKERAVTSVVFNTVSGAIRIFHHRWIPPNVWENSDLYMYTGICLPDKHIKAK
jgi:hypothetical protein